MYKVSCVIPAYNEEKGIGGILSVVVPLIGSELHEVIVIDDCSSDRTKEIIQTFPDIILLEHAVNQGKSKTVADGIAASSGDYIMMLDADLLGLQEQNIIDLIQPINAGISQVTMCYIKNSWPLFPFRSIDFLTGQRAFPKAAVIPSLKAMGELPSYGLEVFLNRIIIESGLSICNVQWPNVENVFSQTKRGWVKGSIIMVGVWLNVISTVSIVEAYSQNIRIKKLLVRSDTKA